MMVTRIGIVLFSYASVRMGWTRLPDGVGWAQIAGGGVLCGIGFTMALFIATLALSGPALAAAKLGILLGSVVAAMIGMLVLSTVPQPRFAVQKET